MLYFDLITVVTEYLSDHKSITLLSMCKEFYYKKKYYTMKNYYELNEIQKYYKDYKFNKFKIYEKYKIPSTCTHLIVENEEFNEDINNLPNLVYLEIISDDFDSKLQNLPSLKQLIIIGNNYNQPVDIEPLTYLELRCNTFDNDICTAKLQELIIDSSVYNKKLNTLPESLNKLTLESAEFNQTLDDLPPLITHLMLNYCHSFNHPVNYLPPLLEHLVIIGKDFNYQICGPILYKINLNHLEIKSSTINKLITKNNIYKQSKDNVNLYYIF
jgi:hypothetical protein